MLGFVFQKMRSKKWMTISLLLGNLLMIAIASAVPLYSQAVMQRTLIKSMGNYLTESGKYPGTVMAKATYNEYFKGSLEDITGMEMTLQSISEVLEVPSQILVKHFEKINVSAVSAVLVDGKEKETSIRLASYSDFADHIQIKYGEMYTGEVRDNVIEAVVNERTFIEQDFVLGEELLMERIVNENKIPYKVRIVGVFENKEKQDSYWLTSPAEYSDLVVMDEALFEDLIFYPANGKVNVNVQWHMVMDYTHMKAGQAETMLQTMEEYTARWKEIGIKSEVYFADILENFLVEEQRLNVTIVVLQAPVFVLLIAFIFMVSRQMLENEQNEIAVFKSRGAAKGQLVWMYLLQSIILAMVGLFGGILLGMQICKMIGSANAFLEFVQRTAMVVELTPNVWMFAVVAAVCSVVTMILPVFKYANVTIVVHKRKKSRKSNRPLWQRLFLDIILLGISLYGLYQFSGQKEYLAQRAMEGAALDPALYFCSSVFILGTGLLTLRLLPIVTGLIYRAGKRFWSPAIHASFLRILRVNDNQGFLVVFLVLTVALGIFSTGTARTINSNAEERVSYLTGADVVLQEKWKDNSETIRRLGGGSEGTESAMELMYEEPDFDKYPEMEGVEKATKVLVNNEIMVALEKGRLENVYLMGIHTKEFGEIAWFKNSLSPTHWYHYLNAMAQNSRAVLVSSNFRDDYDYQIGDTITFTDEVEGSVRGIIYGFVDYWPSYSPVITTRDEDGLYKQTENYLIVAHLSQLQSSWGITPYQVWIKTKGSSKFLYEYARETGTEYVIFKDMAAELISLKNDPVFQGTNGVLTIGFVIVLLLCATGFLIYWILSIQSRTLQFGIFRAMGMGQGEVLSMLMIEQIFISGFSIGAGVLSGWVSSRLFVPLIQIAYSSVDRVIPLEIINEGNDFLRLGMVIGIMIVLCMSILGVLISRIRISQALKLGED